MSVKNWLHTMRLKTLPLALSGALIGNFIALAENKNGFNYLVFSLCITTAVLIQILSNFANDYGDFTNGADTDERTDRLLTTGDISLKQMKFAVYLVGALTLIFGILLLFFAFGIYSVSFWLMLALGVAGIFSAYFYTAGKKPYGYYGLGDLFVFVFFGLVSVLGAYFLQTQTINLGIVALAVAIGLLSVGVLNVNNIRDINSDKMKGKNTLPVKMGKSNALIYHFAILFLSILLIMAFYFYENQAVPYLRILMFLALLGIHFVFIKKAATRMDYNKQLKYLSLSTLFMAFYIGITQILDI